MALERLIQIGEKPIKEKSSTPRTSAIKKQLDRGCESCPAKKAWKHGVKPIMGKVTGKKPIFLVAQNPGKEENKKGKLLVGGIGNFLWREFATAGISREDCDIQTAVRCLTYEKDDLGYRVPRSPNKDEVHCCSIHTESAIAKQGARVWVIVGQLAAKQVLGREYRKDRRIFWSDKHQVKVVCIDHPSFFLHGGSRERLREFRAALRVVAETAKLGKRKTIDKEVPKGMEKFAFLFKQEYIAVTRAKTAKKVYFEIKKAAKKGIRIAADIETDKVKDKSIALLYGFCYKPGLAYSFVLDHPLAKWKSHKDKVVVRKYVKKILEDKHIKKIFHHGCSDVPSTWNTLGVKVRGYDWDSEYAAYFYNSDLKKYGLTALSDRWWPEFSGYKEITMPEALPKGVDYKKGRSAGMLHYSQVPLKKLVPYNCADCDLSKRIQLKTKKAVNPNLMKVYIDASFPIDRMERNGPLLDYVHLDTMKKIYPVRKANWMKKLQQLIEKHFGKRQMKDAKSGKVIPFSPGSPKQLQYYMYGRDYRTKKQIDEKFEGYGFEPPEVYERGKLIQKFNTQQSTLEYYRDNSPNKQGRKFAKWLLYYKSANTICSKSIKSYEISANAHKGQLRTNWWLTGTTTGRLRSGGKKESKDTIGNEKGIVNLQNIDSDPVVMNMIISDPKWHELFEAWRNVVFVPFKQQFHKTWRLLFEKDEKGDKTERAKEMVKKLIAFSKFNWKAWKNLKVFLSFDYSQIEVRMLAQMSGDKTMLDAFLKGIDIHCAVGSKLTGWSIEKIKNDKATRRAVKALHFAIIFGKQAKGLWQQLKLEGVNIKFEKVEKMLNDYWIKFKKCAKLMNGFKTMAEKRGYVLTLFGFRRPIGESENRSSFTENQAVNSPIQGSAHQLVLMAIALLRRQKKLLKILEDLRMEVHDNLVWTVDLGDLNKAALTAADLLEKMVLRVVKSFGVKWRVPLVAEGSAGFRLGTMVDIAHKELDTKVFIDEWCLKCEDKNRSLRKEMKKAA